MKVEFKKARVGKVTFDSATVEKSAEKLASCEVTLHGTMQGKSSTFDVSFDVLDLGNGHTALNPSKREKGVSSRYFFYLAKIVYHVLKIAKEKKKKKKKGANASDNSRCTATTKKGRRCKNKSIDGGQFCGVHQQKKESNGDIETFDVSSI